MATRFDVAGRLAEARQAVEDTQTYVWAAHLLGYQNADLTLHSAQIRDWFSSEDGMDLRVLDTDSAAVQAVATVADDAAARQRDQIAALTAAWQGDGAASAEEFLRRHSDSAEQVATSVRAAAQALAGLRDNLWQIVDTKVATVGEIAERRRAERPTWLPAAQTVITGTGDRSAASELIDQQVKPFVDNDIRNDWLSAMRTAIASIGNSYDVTTAEIAPAPVRFDVPGDFGPDPAPASDDDVAPRGDSAPASAGAAPTASPAAAAPSYPSAPATMSTPAMSTPAMSTPATATPAMATPAMAATPAAAPTGSASPMPTSLPTTPSSGVDGLGQGFADALRGLLPSSGEDTAPDVPDLDPPTLDDPPTDPLGEADAGDEPEAIDDQCDCDPEDQPSPDDPAPTAVDDAAVAEPLPPAETTPPPENPVPPPEVAPPEADPPEAVPPDAPAPVDSTATPCEIAADELPQAGE